MFILLFEKSGHYAYASTESIITKTLKKSGLWRYKYSRILLTDGDILSINSKGKIEMSAFETFSYSSTNSYQFDYYGVKFREMRKEEMTMKNVQNVFIQQIHKPAHVIKTGKCCLK